MTRGELNSAMEKLGYSRYRKSMGDRTAITWERSTGVGEVDNVNIWLGDFVDGQACMSILATARHQVERRNARALET